MLWLFLVTISLASFNVYSRPYLFFFAFIYSAMTGFVNGWTTGKVMKFYGATDWLFAATASSVIFPLYLFFCFMAVDLIEWSKKSNSTVYPWNILLFGTMWVFITIPLACVGSYQAFK